MQLSKAYLDKDPAKSEKLTWEAIEQARLNNDKEFMAKGYFQAGGSQRIYGNLAKADSLLQLANTYLDSTDAQEFRINVYYELGVVSIFRGNIDQAILYSDLGLELAKELDDVNHQASMYILKGGIYQSQYQISKMKESFLMALHHFKQADNLDGQTAAYTNLANTAFMSGNANEAIELYDSVITIAKASQKFTTYAITTVNKGNALLRLRKYDEAKACAEDALKVSQEKGFKNTLVDANNLLADVWTTQSKYHLALPYLQRALETSLEAKAHQQSVRLLEKVGTTLFNLGNYDESLVYFLRELKLADSLGLASGIQAAYSHIANLHTTLQEYEKATSYLQKGLALARQNEDYYSKGLIHLSFGKIHSENQRLDSAKGSFEQAFADFEKSRRSDQKIILQIEMARLNLSSEDYEEAAEWLGKAKSAENQSVMTDYYRALLHWIEGKLELHDKQLSSAIQLFHAALDDALKTNNKRLVLQCYSALASSYRQQGDYGAALNYFEKKHTLKDSLFNINKSLQINKLQTQFETEKKDQQIQALQSEQKVQELTVANQEARLLKQRQNLWLLLLGAFLLASLSLLFFNRYRLKKENQELVLTTKQLELERHQDRIAQQLEMSELRSDFFTNISHEFRTPLTLILGPLEKLLQKEQLEHKPDIERIHRNANQLLSLINETLDLSKIDGGHLPLHPQSTSIGSFIENVVRGFKTLADGKHIELVFSDNSQECLVDVDQAKLKKILLNLLGNAWKHTQEKGRIEVAVGEPDKGQISFQVSDNGMGIKPDDIPYIFDRFYQGKSGVKGTGLGLTLCKQLVELHGGTILVKSQEGEGSTFFLNLPQVQKNDVSKTESEKEEVSTKTKNGETASNNLLSDKTVLIIEDNEDVRLYLKELLEDTYRVLLAADGNQGVEMAEQNSPDLIVSDVMMPYKDGFELTKQLKSHLPTSHIPIILLTAKASLDSKLKGLETGADDYIGKPFNYRELLQRCKNLILQRDKLRSLFTDNYFLSPKKITKNKIDEDFIQKAIGIVESNLENSDFTVEQFCQELAYNRSGVHLKLKAITGQNTSGFIKSIRVKKAAQLLKETDLSVTEVAETTGFGSRQAFNKTFKEQFQLTPTEFRNGEEKVPLNA